MHSSTPGNVVAIRPDVLSSDGKQAFLDFAAQCYDDLSAAAGSEPIGMTVCYVTRNGETQTSYLTADAVSEQNVLYIARMTSEVAVAANAWLSE